MKKNLSKACFVLSVFMLFGCGSKTEMSLYRRTFENGKNVETMKEGEKSEKDIYYTSVMALSNDNNDYEIEAKDFELVMNGNTYTCLYFINEWSSSSIVVNGQETKISYLVSKKDKETVNHGDTATSVWCAFDVEPSEDFSLNYKGKTISFLN